MKGLKGLAITVQATMPSCRQIGLAGKVLSLLQLHSFHMECTRCCLQNKVIRVICTASQGSDNGNVAGFCGVKKVLNKISPS